MNHVVVQVTGTQTDIYGQENKIDMVSVGRHYQKNGINYVTYEDGKADGMEGTTTMLKIAEDCVVLVRKGSVEHKQEFKLDQTSSSLYHTPYGSMTLTILTKRLNVSFGAASGAVDIGYELAVDGQWQSANTLHIKVCTDNNICSTLN